MLAKNMILVKDSTVVEIVQFLDDVASCKRAHIAAHFDCNLNLYPPIFEFFGRLKLSKYPSSEFCKSDGALRDAITGEEPAKSEGSVNTIAWEARLLKKMFIKLRD